MAQMTITQFMTGIKNWVLGKIEAITDLIPSQASSSNKLADKAFVNSSIATATATFQGTYNVVSDLSLSYNATHAQIQTALATKMSALSITPDNNDYAFVQIPTSATSTDIAKVEKYKFNGTAWAFEYELNNSGFTAAQWAAINSGATLELIGKLSALPTNAELTTLLNGKANISEMSVVAGTGANADKTTITLKSGTSATVLTQHQDISGKENTSNKVTTITEESTDTQYGSAKSIWTLVATAITTIKSWAEGLFAKMDGFYENLGVGGAKNLIAPNITEGAFFARPTGGEDAELANGLAQLQVVKGRSVKYNQLVQNGNFANGTTRWNFSRATGSVSNGVCTITQATYNSGGFEIHNTSIALTSGKKYYISYQCKANKTFKSRLAAPFVKIVNNLSANTWHRISGVGTCNSTTFLDIYFLEMTGNNNVGNIKNIICLDLTALGIDNLTTVKEVEDWLAANYGAQEYYPYSEGSVVNVNMTGIESFKKNLLNPTTGKAYILGAYSEVYGNYYGICGTHGTLTFTDAYGNESTITPDSDGKFELTVAGELTVADAGADCAVFLWWDGTETEYSEYGTNIGRLDITHIYGRKNGTGDMVRVWPTGSCGLGGLQDLLTIEDGAVVAKRLIGEVDLGSISSWIIQSTYAYFSRSLIAAASNSILLSDKLRFIESGIASNIMCVSRSESYINVNIDNVGSNVASGSNGIKLYFLLETPETYTDLVYMGSDLFEDGTPVTLPVNYEADNWGIERVLPLNTSEAMLTAMPTLTCKYSIDAVEQLDTHTAEIESIKENYVSAKSNQEFTDEEQQQARKNIDAVGFGDMDKEYPKLFAGNLVGEPIPVSTGYTLKATGYDPTQPELEFADGPVKMAEIQGRACAWNQYIKPISSTNFYTTDATATFSNGVCAFTASAQDGRISSNNGIRITTKHKFFITVDVKAALNAYFGIRMFAGYYIRSVYGTGEWHTYAEVKNIDGLANEIVEIRDFRSSGWDEIQVRNYMLIDLTLLNPTLAAKANLTVAEVEAYLASIRTPKPYYAQNAGVLLGAKMLGWQLRKTANLLNPTTKQAKLFEYDYTGHNNEYTVTGFDGLTNAALQFTPYATGVAGAVTLDANNRFVIPSAGVLEIVASGGDITGDISRVCVVATWDGSMDGEVVAFEEDDVQIDSANIYYDNNGVKTQVFEGGILRSTGDGSSDVHDRLYWDDVAGKWKSVQPVGDANLGSFTDWTEAYTRAATTALSSIMKKPSENSIPLKAISSAYAVVARTVVSATNYNITCATDGNLEVKNPNFAGKTSAQIQSLLTGIHLWFELKTPITHDTLYYKVGNDYVPMEQVFPDGIQGLCCNWASENLVEQAEVNGQPQSITPITTEVFQSDMKELLKTVGDTYISKEQAKDSFDNLLTQLNTNSGTALGGTYATDGFNDDGTIKFAFTANE